MSKLKNSLGQYLKNASGNYLWQGSITAYTITANLTGCSASVPSYIHTGESLTITLSASSGYALPSSVSVSGCTYSYSNGVISLSNPSANVTITAVGIVLYTITGTATNCFINGSTSYSGQVASGSSVTLNLTADGTFYKLPTSLSVTGGVYTRTSDTSGTLVITPTTNVSFTVEGEAIASGETCTISGLGSSSTSSVTFTKSSGWSDTYEQVTISGDTFVKFPTMWRKVNATSSGQITSVTIATAQIDSSYQVYPCFLKEDGTSIMPYVLMGQYCSTSSSTANSQTGAGVRMTIGAGRTLCQARGTGYQQMDWMIFKLWQDLLCCKMETINTNSGSGITQDALGIYWEQNSSKTSPWVDGINRVNNTWVACAKPNSYTDSATSSTSDYFLLGYSAPGSSSTTSGCISKLGYDANNPFVNYPNEIVTDSSYSTYYCDAYYSSSNTNSPVYSIVGVAVALCGAFYCNASYSWSDKLGVRLCYRPLSE